MIAFDSEPNQTRSYCFTGFYWVLLVCNGFYWVLLGFTGFYWVLMGFTGFYWVLLGFTGFLLSCSGFLLGCTGTSGGELMKRRAKVPIIIMMMMVMRIVCKKISRKTKKCSRTETKWRIVHE